MQNNRSRLLLKIVWIILALLLITWLPACQASGQIFTPTSLIAQPTDFVVVKDTPTPQPTATPLQLVSPIKPTNSPTPTRFVNLVAVGDIMLARTIGGGIHTDGINYPFKFIADTLMTADITTGNLECVISADGEAEEKTYTFRAPNQAADALSYAGFDLLNLANNHILDFGTSAMLDTIDNLSKKKIATIGAGVDALAANSPVIIEINGLRLGFLGYLDIPVWKYDYTQWQAGINSPGIAWGYRYEIKTAIEKTKEKADVVIVFMHFGNEYEAVVSQSQMETAHTAIDAGASLVVGSHPHLLQAVEEYHGGLIAYSLGNFVFDQFSGNSNRSIILQVLLSPDGISSYQQIPVVINSKGQPTLQEQP